MADLSDLAGVASRILTVFNDQLEAQKVPLPASVYVHAGTEAAWDGEQLTSGLVGVQQGAPGMPVAFSQQPLALNFYAEFHVLLLRQVTTLQEGPVMVPPTDDLAHDGDRQMKDVQALIRAFSQIALGHLLVDPGEGLVMAGCRPVGPQGGLAGSEILLHLTVR